MSTSTADVIWEIKYQLATIIDPDHGLLDHLLDLSVLDDDECKSVRSRTNVNERVIKLLQLICNKTEHERQFMDALKQNQQTHVVNFILAKRGNYYKLI